MAPEKQELALTRNRDKSLLIGTIGNLANIENNLIEQGQGPCSKDLANIGLAIDFAKMVLNRWDDDSRKLGLNVKPICTGDDNER